MTGPGADEVDSDAEAAEEFDPVPDRDVSVLEAPVVVEFAELVVFDAAGTAGGRVLLSETEVPEDDGMLPVTGPSIVELGALELVSELGKVVVRGEEGPEGRAHRGPKQVVNGAPVESASVGPAVALVPNGRLAAGDDRYGPQPVERV